MKNIKTTGKEKSDIENKSKEPVEESKINVDITENIKSKGLNNDMGDRLKEAIVWSEILGQPLSKRKKRIYHGN